MPLYEYVADTCRRQPACSRRQEYIQSIGAPPLTACRECGAPIQRIFSSFAARSGTVGVSSPDPTPLNVSGIPAPSAMPSGEGGGCGGDHQH
ncbi:hypothetical protein YTPLAS18_12010 [Nitrospira sp.]|nr:hypothetical protein YTPLAS18_12010 [Nitrospira sp.]